MIPDNEIVFAAVVVVAVVGQGRARDAPDLTGAHAEEVDVGVLKALALLVLGEAVAVELHRHGGGHRGHPRPLLRPSFLPLCPRRSGGSAGLPAAFVRRFLLRLGRLFDVPGALKAAGRAIHPVAKPCSRSKELPRAWARALLSLVKSVTCGALILLSHLRAKREQSLTNGRRECRSKSANLAFDKFNCGSPFVRASALSPSPTGFTPTSVASSVEVGAMPLGKLGARPCRDLRPTFPGMHWLEKASRCGTQASSRVSAPSTVWAKFELFVPPLAHRGECAPLFLGLPEHYACMKASHPPPLAVGTLTMFVLLWAGYHQLFLSVVSF